MAGCTCAADDRMWRNLIALLPYTVQVRKVVVITPKPPTAVVLFKPSHGRPGRRLGWS